MAKELDPKYLEGIVFSGARTVKGQKKNEQFTRPATIKDVLSFSESEDSVLIVIADGKKYTVARKAQKKETDKK